MTALKKQTQRPEPKRAKPVKGPVDYAALRKRIIARFPKTIAYLAK